MRQLFATALVIAAFGVGSVLAQADTAISTTGCPSIKDDTARLACFDEAFPPPGSTTAAGPAAVKVTAPAPVTNGTVGAWHLSTEKDAMTDKTTVTLLSQSTEKVPGRFASNDFAQLLLQCRNNTTTLVIYFGGAFMSSSEYDRFGEVTYRVDDKKAVTKTFDNSTSNQHLGLWSGGVSIPVIKQMFGGLTFRIAATPYNENPVQLEFPIDGIEQAVIPLRKACGW